MSRHAASGGWRAPKTSSSGGRRFRESAAEEAPVAEETPPPEEAALPEETQLPEVEPAPAESELPGSEPPLPPLSAQPLAELPAPDALPVLPPPQAEPTPSPASYALAADGGVATHALPLSVLTLTTADVVEEIAPAPPAPMTGIGASVLPAAPARPVGRRATTTTPPPGGYSRRRWWIAGAVVGAIILVALGVWLTHRQQNGAEPAPTPAPTDAALRQPTLLFQLRDDESLAIANSLMAVGGPADQGVQLMIPSQLWLDVPTGGNLPLAQVARLPDPNASANALSDVLGVRVDGTLVLDRLAFAGLVDAVGGVDVPVDTDVIVTNKDGTKKILVTAGSHKLDGPTAAAFASYLAPGEVEAKRMARFTLVMNQVFKQLPTDVRQVESILTSLGSLAHSTVPTSTVAAFMHRMQAYVLAQEVVYDELAVKPLDVGGPVVAYQVDQNAAAKQVETLLPDAIRTPGPNTKVRVLVYNGVGTPGLNTAARQQLVDAGFTYVNGGNSQAGFSPTAKTVIIIPDNKPASVQWGTDVATALNVPLADVRTPAVGDGQSIADVLVTLGTDFQPPPSPS